MNDWNGNGNYDIGDQKIFDDITKSNNSGNSGSSGNSHVIFWIFFSIVCLILDAITGGLGTIIFFIGLILKFFRWVTGI